MPALFDFNTKLFSGRPPRPGAINENLGGDELAAWLSERLRARGLAASAPWAEDHGYDFDVSAGDQRYLVVCARDFDEESDNPGHHGVVVEKVRRFFDVILRRGRLDADDRVVEAVSDILRDESGVHGLTREFKR